MSQSAEVARTRASLTSPCASVARSATALRLCATGDQTRDLSTSTLLC
jgi:hypothetical protein